MEKPKYTVEELREELEELEESGYSGYAFILRSAMQHVDNLQEDNARLRRKLDDVNGVIR